MALPLGDRGVSERVVLLAFSVLRERLGWSRKEVPWEAGTTPLSLWRAHIGGDREGVAPAAGLRFCGWGEEVAPGNEVAFIPPVAGGR